MSEIAIVTDTDASLPAELMQHFGIYPVPITVQFGEESFQSGVDIDDASLFARVDREGRLPTTSAPAPGKFLEVFQQALADGAQQVLCFTVSKEVSASFDAAVNAARMLPDGAVTVVDTRSLSLVQGFMVLAAAEALQEGADAAESLARAAAVGEQTHLFAALSSLKYLAMSGRVGHLAAGFADLFNVKPILTIRDARLEMLERVRTQRKAWTRLLSLSAEAIGPRPVLRMGVVHVNAPQAAEDFITQLRLNLPVPEEILVAELTPGLSVHTGAGLVGVAFVLGTSGA